MTEDAITNVVNIVEFHSGSAGRGRFGLLGGVLFAGDPGTPNKSNAMGVQAVIPWVCVGYANALSPSWRQRRVADASAGAGSERAV